MDLLKRGMLVTLLCAGAQLILPAACMSSTPSGGEGGGHGGQGAESSSGEGGILPSSVGNGGEAGSCAGNLITAEPALVDMYVTLDKSISMSFSSGQGKTKWDAVEAALASFLQDPAASGLGVALSFFPPTPPGAPVVCKGGDCGAAGPCVLGICDDSSGFCESNADCAGTCIPFGLCKGDPNGNACENVGGNCPGNYPCVDFPRTCAGALTCSTADYTKPVAAGQLPAAAPQLVQAFADEEPNGIGTPMRVALLGATTAAKGAAIADPARRPVVVLVTDGEPTTCEPATVDAVAAVAQTALSSAPYVRTFVIGVFGPDDPGAPAKMNEIAAAGGTGSALIVNTAQDVTSDFLTALLQIQQALGCVFDIPKPGAGETVDYASVNLVHTPPGGSAFDVPYVGSESGCDSDGGWYYGPGEPPTSIIVCDSSCKSFEQGGTVEIKTGCLTVVK